MADDNAQLIMRAIGRLEGKVEDILTHQKDYNSKQEKLADKIIEHERHTYTEFHKYDQKNSEMHKSIGKRVDKNTTAIAKFMGIVAFIGFVVSVAFNAVWQWIAAAFNN